MKFRVVGILWVLMPIWAGMALAQPPAPTPPSQAQQLALSQQSLETTLAAESANLDQLKKWLRDAQQAAKASDAELNAYKIQISSYNSLLLAPTTQLDDLEAARESYRVIADNLAKRLKDLSKQQEAIKQAALQAEEQYALNQKQLTEINTGNYQDASIRLFLTRLRTLTETLANKRDLLARLQANYAGQITPFEALREDVGALAGKFDQQFEARKTRELFERKANPLALLGWEQIQKEFGQLGKQGRLLFSGEFWAETLRTLWQFNGFLLVTFVVLFGVNQFLFLRLRRFGERIAQQPFCLLRPWRGLTLRLLQASLPLLGATLFLYGYAQTRLLYAAAPLLQISGYLLWLGLSRRWLLDLLHLWPARTAAAAAKQLRAYVRLAVNLSCAFGVVYVLCDWMLSSSSVILLLWRVLFEISLSLWSVPFWRIFRKTPVQLPVNPQSQPLVRSLLMSLGYVIANGGLLLELIGYGPLALYWYLSWGRSLVILLWGTLVFLAIREWNQAFRKSTAAETPELAQTTRRPLQWLCIRLCWLAWATLLLVCGLLAWGAKRIVLVGFFQVLNYPLQIGGIRLSVLGILYAFLILSVTHAIAQICRRLFENRIMRESGLELGLQASITTITVYLLWAFGILAALHAIGISTTSLALLFGALGIGLGFGLQNIFNNFISGLILLFERPIKVGDVVEINSIWGTVAQINVRSTVVRTFDNAALIIPNADIISNQLTNWTFKDVRMRRTITVGVAYGSDVKSVERLLYEIAEQHPRVLKNPAPEVLFADFGDSALIFKLRVWTIIDYGVPAENAIRFEIDRIFREKNITIPFPQRDLHLYPAAAPAAQPSPPEKTQDS